MDLNNGRDAVKRDLQITKKEMAGSQQQRGRYNYTDYNRDIGSWHQRKLNAVCAGDSLGESDKVGHKCITEREKPVSEQL